MIFFCYTLCMILPQNAQQKDTAEPYSILEFPDWAQQIRRTEIITLGSLPFTTLSVTTAYSVFRYAKNNFNPDYIPNPLAKSSSAANLNEEEQKNIVIAAVSVSALVGLVDLVITIIKNAKKSKTTDQSELPDSIVINKKLILQETDE